MQQENGIRGKKPESGLRDKGIEHEIRRAIDSDLDLPKESNTGILLVYILLAISIATMFVPVLFFAIISIVLLTLVMIIVAIMKGASIEGSLAQNHGIYISKTIWITCFIAILTTIPSVIYINKNIDISPMQPCSQSVAERLLATGTIDISSVDIPKLSAMLQPCIPPFLEVNHDFLINGVLIAFILPLLYMVLRSIKGFVLAVRSKSPAKPKSAL